MIGATVEEVDKIRAAKGPLLLSASSDWRGSLQAIQGMIEVGGLPDVTSGQVSRSRTAYKSALSNLENFKKILDIHTARWFVQHPNGKTKGNKAKPKEDPFDFILKSGDLFNWSHGKKAPLLDVELYRTLLSECARVAKEKRFFHRELEFPEVFYGPRPSTTQAIQRLEGTGFDAVVGNRSYDEPSHYDSNTTEGDKAFFSESPSYHHFKNGRINLYRLFIVKGIEETAAAGMISFIIPMTLLADDFSCPTREFLLDRTNVIVFEAFPQKDNPRHRVFPEAKLSTCVFVTKNCKSVGGHTVRTHPGREFELDSSNYQTTSDELRGIFTNHLVIPTISENEWAILKRAFRKEDWPRLRTVADVYVGEIFDNAPNKRFLSDEAVGPLILRGANIDRYFLRNTLPTSCLISKS